MNEITVAQITRTIRNIDSEVRLLPADGMPADCVINCDHIQTLPRHKLGDRSLGWVNAVRFIQQYEASSRDYTTERDATLPDWDSADWSAEQAALKGRRARRLHESRTPLLRAATMQNQMHAMQSDAPALARFYRANCLTIIESF